MTTTGEQESVASDGRQASGPIRTCVGCRVSRAQDRLIRLGLDGARVVPALGRRDRVGRGAWLCPRRDCLDRAIKRRAFTRAFSSQQTLSQQKGRPVETLDAAAAEQLWSSILTSLRREIELLDRSAANPHAHPRRTGLERLLFELSSTPTSPDRRPSANGQGGATTHG